MRNIHVLTLIAIASLCATALHGAVPPAAVAPESPEERTAREQVQAYQEATGTKLAAPAPEIIQKYLMAQRVPIKIINNDTDQIYKKFAIVFRDIPRLSVLASTPVGTDSNPKTIEIPLMPMRVDLDYTYHLYEGLWQYIIRKIESFELSMQDLRNIESITINRKFIEIRDNNGVTRRKNYTTQPIPLNLPAE